MESEEGIVVGAGVLGRLLREGGRGREAEGTLATGKGEEGKLVEKLQGNNKESRLMGQGPPYGRRCALLLAGWETHTPLCGTPGLPTAA